MFFGGNTNNTIGANSNSFNDIKALDENLVVSSSRMPNVGAGLQGFTYDTNYALVCDVSGAAYIYDNNLQIVDRFFMPTSYAMSSYAAATSTFGAVLAQNTPATSLIIF